MTDYSSIDITMERPRRSPTFSVLLSDFANMLKAFIGSNYLTIAYAFTQSGLVPGIILLVLIASITDHCCHLIVKCKYAAIGRITDRHKGVLGDDTDGKDGEMSAELSSMRQKMVRNMTYGDVGRTAFGSTGLLVVNLCLMFTQFGFCVGYFIFLGNTMYHLFPYKNTTLEYDVGNTSSSSSSYHHPYYSSPPPSSFSYNTSGSDVITHTDQSNLSNTIVKSRTNLADDDISNIMVSTVSTLVERLMSNISSTNHTTNTTTTMPNITTTTTTNISTTSAATILSTITTAGINTTTTTAMPYIDLSHIIGISESPDLRLLVITPLPIFVGFAFLRDIRHLGFVSVAADFAIFIGCIVTMVVLNLGFTLSDTWSMYELMKIPVFFGMVTSAFEGIGTIIPIESSMEGNRHNFGRFLHGAIVIMTLILLSFGILGYLRYGDETAQMINKNMPDGTIGVLINICLCIGVVLTFPLQIYPVIELSEIYLFGNDRLCGPKTRRHRKLSETVNKLRDDDDGDENDSDDDNDDDSGMEDGDSLLSRSKSSDVVATTVSDEVSTWKRNVLRILLVVIAGGMAVLLRDLYAYVSAFIGAVGSSMLAYILPCIFHLKLCWSTSGRGVLFKDVVIIVFGIIASIFSLYSTVKEVIDRVG